MELKWVWFSIIRIAMMSVLLVLGDACLEQERLALLQLKPFFNHYDELVDWDEAVNGSDCCRWKGIECNTTNRRLIALTLNSTRYGEGWYLNASLFLPFVELKRLYLQENAIAGCIQNEGFEKLSSKLRNLEILDLSRNYLKDSIVLSLSQLSSLRYLSLAYNRLEGSTQTNGFQWLSRLGNLETLDLTGNYLKNNIFSHISGLSSLKTLSLSGIRLSGQLLHIQELNNLTKLKHLDLSDNGLESISNQDETQLKLTKLERLDLSGNRNYRHIAATIDETQMKLTKLERLDLSGNRFRNNTFSFLKGLSSLKSLDMSSNDLRGSLDLKDGERTLQQLTCLEELNLNGNLLNNSVFASLNGFRNLKFLHISNNQLNGSLNRTDLDAFSSLRELYLGVNQLKDVTIYKGVCDLKNLQVLDLSRNSFEGMLPHCLGDLTSLRELDVSENHFSGTVTHLENLTTLEYLSLSRNHFQIPMSFLEHFPNLQVLLIDDNKMVMEPSFQFHTSVSKLQLRFISVSNCLTSAELHLQLLTFLYYQYDLRYVDLSENNFSGTFPNWLLQNNTKLESLRLKGNSFSGPLSLPSDSAPNWNVSLVDISDNKLQGQIPSNICATFPHLRGLFLSKNDFEGNIPPCLSGMKYLSLLDLSNNRLSGRLPEELITKDGLFVLRLSNNDLYGNVSPAILKANWLLQLYLDGNNFAFEMTNIDVSAFEFPTCLESSQDG